MLIAQITDIHLGFDPDNPAEFNRKRLDRVLRTFEEMERRPDLIIASGDLVDRGDAASYRRLRIAFDGCEIPVWPCLGNHDLRASFSRIFPDYAMPDGFLQYSVDAGPLRILVLDTLEEGRHGGGFCEIRARWLAERVAEEPDRPTLIVLHHPPVETGIGWMTSLPDEYWIQRLREALSGARNVVGMICGHIHRQMTTIWEGRVIAVCASSAPQVALDLSTIDADKPDNRAMIVADPPGYALHLWTGERLISHFDVAEDHVTLARYDEGMQPLVAMLMSEGRGG
jgi:3',5'-cyclic AMP phosphodiesterase CpdA